MFRNFSQEKKIKEENEHFVGFERMINGTIVKEYAKDKFVMIMLD